MVESRELARGEHAPHGATGRDARGLDGHDSLGQDDFDFRLRRVCPDGEDGADVFRDAGRGAYDERAGLVMSDIEVGVSLEPDLAPVHLNLALTYSIIGDDVKAMEHYRTARRLNPAIPELPAR